MASVQRFGKTLKQHVKSRQRSTDKDPVGALVRFPLYVAAGGLLCVYGWGSLSTFPQAMGVALCAVFAMSELLKPKLGELAAEALAERDRVGSTLMLAASVACIALGALGGVIAMGAANGPREAYDAAQGRLASAETDLRSAQQRLDEVPTCTPDMPRVRCEAQTANNAATLRDRAQTRDERKQERDAAKSAAEAIPNPGPGVPHIELWQKALVIAAVEFVLFAVPFAARRRSRPKLALVAETAPAKPEAKAKPINDGGWERRRQLYGPSGRKPRVLGLVMGSA